MVRNHDVEWYKKITNVKYAAKHIHSLFFSTIGSWTYYFKYFLKLLIIHRHIIYKFYVIESEL